MKNPNPDEEKKKSLITSPTSSSSSINNNSSSTSKSNTTTPRSSGRSIGAPVLTRKSTVDRTFTTIPVTEWNANHAANWFLSLGAEFSQFEQAFRDAKIDGMGLLSITGFEDMVHKLGLTASTWGSSIVASLRRLFAYIVRIQRHKVSIQRPVKPKVT